MEFEELKDVDLREAWPNEAHDFTPWLADNLERLSRVIGIPLEAEGTEVAVEGFAADILARNPMDGSRVLIENQLEGTDHTHLGQVLTYLAGLEAQTVIWVAREFHGAHLSAIRWLNEHTVEPFAFFAVRVRVVRIGDDSSLPMAPLFEVLERPSGWERQFRASVQEASTLSESGQFRREFWQHYTNRHPDDGVRVGYAGSNVWHPVIDTSILLSQYVAVFGVGVYLRSGWNESSEQVFPIVENYAEALQHELEVELGNSSDGWWALKTLRIDSRDRANWPQMVDWLHENLVAYRRVLTADATADN